MIRPDPGGGARALIYGCVLLASPVLAQRPATDSLTATAYVHDFGIAWTFVRDNYAYFDRKQTDWDKVGALYRPLAAAVTTKREFVGLLEDMLEELYDPHAHLGINTSSSPRLVPSGTDLWAEWRGGRAVVTEVRRGSSMERAGLRAGMEVTSVDDVPVRDAVGARSPKALRAQDPAADDWALMAVLAGRRSAPVIIATYEGARRRTFLVRPGPVDSAEGVITARILTGNIAYVRVNDALGDTALISAWDSVLMLARDTHGLILDLRNTPGGGNTTVARGIMSRLVATEQPYQRHELPAEERKYGVRRVWIEYVAPRGPYQYDKPVVVLVGRWTGSMGEGITIGLDAMQRATVVGTRMAGLLGATYGVTLPNTQIPIRIPAERLYHVRGTPREAFVPPVQPRSSASSDVDAALDEALSILRAPVATRRRASGR